MSLQLFPSWVWHRANPEDHEALRRIGISLGLLAERWGPAAVKVAQLAASRRDLLPTALLQPLERLQDQLSAPSKAALRHALDRAYGQPRKWPFRLVSWEPIASGSIATVLPAEANDGTPLAIKIVRPGVRRQVLADLSCLLWLARRLERHHRFSHLPLTDALLEISKSVEQQCDMLREAEGCVRIQLSLVPGITSPVICEELSRDSVLVMELRRGTHKFTDSRVPAEIFRMNSRLLLQALYRMIFVNGFVHCDLHPGNVVTDGSGGIILYDLGLSADLSARDRNILTGLFEAIDGADAHKLASQIIAAADTVPAHLDVGALRADAQSVIERWSGRRAGDFLVAALANDLFAMHQRHGIRGRPSYVAGIWALATFEGLIRERYPDLDFQREARPFLKSALIAKLRPRALSGFR